MTTTYQFKAGYTKAGVAATASAAPTINIVDSSNNLLVNAGSCTAIANMPGLYLYNYSGADNLTVIGLFHTTDTSVDQQDFYSYTPYEVELPGANAETYTVTDGVNPLDGVQVWVSTDSAGSNIVASGNTDAFGHVTFYLNNGTYYFWKQLSGYSFTNPETVTVP